MKRPNNWQLTSDVIGVLSKVSRKKLSIPNSVVKLYSFVDTMHDVMIDFKKFISTCISLSPTISREDNFS